MPKRVAGYTIAVFGSTSNKCRLTISTKKRYVSVAPVRKTKYSGGKDTNPNAVAREVNGRNTPARTIERVVAVNAILGLLRKGFPAVRIMNRTRVCVASDSTNQPVWNKASLAL